MCVGSRRVYALVLAFVFFCASSSNQVREKSYPESHSVSWYSKPEFKPPSNLQNIKKFLITINDTQVSSSSSFSGKNTAIKTNLKKKNNPEASK